MTILSEMGRLRKFYIKEAKNDMIKYVRKYYRFGLWVIPVNQLVSCFSKAKRIYTINLTDLT